MVPIEATFRKMIRLVHDLSAKAGKRIELKLLGEDTEVDRTVAELISDPLVHMVRNSIDHGIETPAERVRSGKPESGTLTIEARYQAGEVWIIVSDNGRGLNRDKILAKGLERGLVPPGAALRDEEIYNLIFLPGFSTADRITDVSGRGVGMDVVKRNIERIRGRVEIQTTPGQGTRFTIRIPLTLAIISGMLVRVGAERYIIPLLCIRESLHPTADMLHTVTGRGEMIMMRGELLPLFRLAQLFSTAGAIGDAAQGIVVVVQDGPLRVGLLVDELLGQQQTVIKSLGDMFGDIKGVSGASIMSDGRIGLILDIEGIVKLAHGV
jgi:two-component system chemotaxis sensor kinase CheA